MSLQQPLPAPSQVLAVPVAWRNKRPAAVAFQSDHDGAWTTTIVVHLSDHPTPLEFQALGQAVWAAVAS